MPGRVRGVVVTVAAAALAALAGCGGGTEPEPTPPPESPATVTTAPAPPPPAAQPTAPAVTLFEFEIAGGRAEPPLQRATVEQGATVRIVVTGDEPDELHLHGYDLEAAFGPGQPGVIEFVADRTGQFELETHGSGGAHGIVLLQLLVR